MTRPVRIVCVTAGLIGGGALFGGVAGAAAAWIALAVSGHVLAGDPGVLALGAYVGTPIGAMALPVTAWVLLRKVALGRVILWSVAGTVVGGVLGWLTAFGGDEALGGLRGAVAGFVLAAVLMWIGTRVGGSRFPARFSSERSVHHDHRCIPAA